MVTRSSACAVLLATLASPALAQTKSVDRQVQEAISALPNALRDGATVMGYRGDQLEVIRQGTGEMICLADNPTDDRWHIACYHVDLEPFMARGRGLRTQGVTDVNAARTKEVEAGQLPFPTTARELYSLTGTDDSFDPTTGESSASGLLVLYIPYATQESSGVSTAPSRTNPWLMNPGQLLAHVMIPRPPNP